MTFFVRRASLLLFFIVVSFAVIPTRVVVAVPPWTVSPVTPTIVAVGAPTTFSVSHLVPVTSCSLFVGSPGRNVGTMTLSPADGSPGIATLSSTNWLTTYVHAECTDMAGVTQAGAATTVVALPQGGWVDWSPGGTTHYNGVSFVNSRTGWTVGTGGVIRKSTDGGHTWVAQSSGTTATLNNAQFIPGTSRGWAVGASGTILSTANGITWSPQPSGLPVSSALNSIAMLAGDGMGWAVGDGGTVRFTSNGGGSWTGQTSGTTAKLNDVAALDGTTAWAVGEAGTIIKKNPTGEEWTTEASGVPATTTLYGVYFINSQVGWAVGLGGTIRKTTDGGATWVGQTSPTSVTLKDVYFLNETIGWIVGNGGTILKTVDGGTIWTIQTTPATSNILNAISVFNGSAAWAVGANGTLFRLDAVSPSTPLGVTRTTPPNDTTPTFTWNASADDTGVASYEYAVDSGAWVNAGNVLTVTLATPLSDGNTHRFKVHAKDLAGNVSGYFNMPAFIIDTTGPTVPGAFSRTTGNEDNTPTFTWTASSDGGSGIAQYQILFDEEVFTPIGNVLTYTLMSPMVNGTHIASLVAMDAADNVSDLATITFTIAAPVPAPPDASAPSVPTGVVRNPPETNTTPTFHWTASTDNVAVASYEVELSQFLGMEGIFGVPVTNVGNVLSFTVPNEAALTPGIRSEFYVRAVDAAGNRSGWSAKSPFTVAADTTPPSSPGNLRRTSSDTDTTPTFTWDPATDDSGISFYDVNLDGAGWQSIDDLVSYTVPDESPLSVGAHTISVRANDRAFVRNAGQGAELMFTIATTGGGCGGCGTTSGTTTGGGSTFPSGGGTSSNNGSGTTVTGGSSASGSNSSGSSSSSNATSPSRPPFTLAQMQADAELIVQGDSALLLPTLGLANATACQMDSVAAALKVEKVFPTVPSPIMHAAFNQFTSCGTVTTLHLGAGERLGALNSYKSAFGRLPSTAAQWFDVIKIANGRFPGEASATAEAAAKVRFRSMYKRDPNMTQQNDKAAVNVMAYGLRPLPRNVNSERVAILSYKKLFGRGPVSAIDWDAVRAIAYSGAVR